MHRSSWLQRRVLRRRPYSQKGDCAGGGIRVVGQELVPKDAWGRGGWCREEPRGGRRGGWGALWAAYDIVAEPQFVAGTPLGARLQRKGGPAHRQRVQLLPRGQWQARIVPAPPPPLAHQHTAHHRRVHQPPVALAQLGGWRQNACTSICAPLVHESACTRTEKGVRASGAGRRGEGGMGWGGWAHARVWQVSPSFT